MYSTCAYNDASAIYRAIYSRVLEKDSLSVIRIEASQLAYSSDKFHEV